ncbi:uncharacterized protein LOC143605772 [Bidens hawaiensis]|uniref:uncharacterized protein LOC143605772 n=1 Tax=Bidens hawaiensis TaxID=980011 RepID=UPI00404A7CA6
MDQVGELAYQLELPEELSGNHKTFQVSHLQKCLPTTYVPPDDLEVDAEINYVARPIEVLDRKVRRLRDGESVQVKIKWEHKKGSDITWEFDENIKRHYPSLFVA